MSHCRSQLSVLAVALPLFLAAQGVPRPELSTRADTNDWTAYYDHGVEQLRRYPSRADAAFYWATRLDPTRAEPRFGRWVAFWLRTGNNLFDYWEGELSPRDTAGLGAAEAHYLSAVYRNPLVPQNLEVIILDELGRGRWKQDPGTRGYLAQAQGRNGEAVELYARSIAQSPKKRHHLRYLRTIAFVQLGEMDSAAVELSQLIDLERSAADENFRPEYQSLELLEYALGLIYLAKRDNRRGREALDRALLEDLGFSPARVILARLFLANGDVAAAVRELALVIEVDGNDAVYRLEYGRALARAGRRDEAAAEQRKAIELAPHYADPYFELARVLDAAGHIADAGAAYRAYLARAPQSATSQVAHARARLRTITPP